MTREYWNKKHIGGLHNGVDLKPSLFGEYATQFFPKEGKILEIGTGKGGDANFFRMLGYQVTAIDYSDEALHRAKENFQDIEFMNHDMRDKLPFPDGIFEIVYSHMAIHYFDKETTEKVFQEIYRVLKPGGIIAVMTNTTDDDETKSLVEVEPDFYSHPEKGITKRYFSIQSMSEFTKDLYQTVIIDNKGEAHFKPDIKTLIRFIGKKI